MASDTGVGKSGSHKGTNQFMRQGHTATNAYGNSPSTDAKGAAGASPKDLKP